MINSHSHTCIFQRLGASKAMVTVCISLYNYADFVQQALESVAAQTIDLLDLIIVDDCSKDQSNEIVLRWLEHNHQRFNTSLLIQHHHNSGGPAGPRNTAINLSQTPYIFILDADNLIFPRCITRCLETLEESDASFAYPLIEMFGTEIGIMGNQIWSKELLAHGNFIDTMSLIRKICLDAVDGYSYMSIIGWEDFDLWCKFAEKGYYGVQIPEILARYRSHSNSMLQAQTNAKITFLIEDMIQRHPWLRLK